MLFCIGYIFWTKILDYNAPVPWFIVFYGVPSLIVGAVAIPIFAPYGCFEEQEFKRKSSNFVKYELLWVLFSFVKPLLSKIFDKLKYTDAQCVIAFLVPIVKRCTNLILSKVINQMVGTERRGQMFHLRL